jgi:hypothetical protein
VDFRCSIKIGKRGSFDSKPAAADGADPSSNIPTDDSNKSGSSSDHYFKKRKHPKNQAATLEDTMEDDESSYSLSLSDDGSSMDCELLNLPPTFTKKKVLPSNTKKALPSNTKKEWLGRNPSATTSIPTHLDGNSRASPCDLTGSPSPKKQ